MSDEVHRNYMDAKQAYWKAEHELAVARADLTMAERALREKMDRPPQPAIAVGAPPKP